MENISQEVPEDLQRQILSWMPSKSLMRFMCVSKNWSSTIRDENFKDLQYERSNTRPRALFVFCRKALDPTPDFLFHSVHQAEEPLLSSGQQQMRLLNEPLDEISAPIRGLICLQSRTKVVICNPGINKFVTLPKLVESKLFFVRSFFGYNEVTRVFKVLCMIMTESGQLYKARQHRVYTVGSGLKCWRPIGCKHRHCPVTNSLCKGGVVYYGAWTSPDNNSVLMSFDLTSEEFIVINLPQGVKITFSTKLVNYKGHIALVNDSGCELYVAGEFQVWVWNEITREWRGEGVAIPCWRETVEDMAFSFEGTIGTRELVFTQKGLLDDGKSFFVVYYNKDTNNLKKFKIEGGAQGGSYHFARIFLNHVDSLSLP